MTSLSDAKKTYREVQDHLNTDPALEHWGHRERKCRALYTDIVKSEPAIMEWEVDYWGRWGKWGLPFFCFMAFSSWPLLLAHYASIDRPDEYLPMVLGTFFFFCAPILILVLGAEWYPTRYY